MSQWNSINYNFTWRPTSILFRHLMHTLLNTGSFFHLSCCYSALLCCCFCRHSGLCQYDKWLNIWDYGDKWQSPMKLTCTKLDGKLFLRFRFDSSTSVLAQCFSKQEIVFNFLIVSFLQVLAPHQLVHVIPPAGHFNYH